jgi:hypothetical protein
MADFSTDSRENFVASLRAIADRAALVDHQRFKDALATLPDGDWTPTEWHPVVDFCADQRGRWQVEWLFSPATAPNFGAKAEMEAWVQVWSACALVLTEQVPGIDELLQRQFNLVAAKHALQRREQHNEKHFVARFSSPVLSRVAILLSQVGLRGAGHSLYQQALYPRETVGRTGAQ